MNSHLVNVEGFQSAVLICRCTAGRVSLVGSPCLVLQHSPGRTSLGRATLACALPAGDGQRILGVDDVFLLGDAKSRGGHRIAAHQICGKKGERG